MINSIKIIIKLKTATNTNSFIYFLKRLWLIGKLFKDSMYSDSDTKNTLAIVVSVLVQIKNLFTTGIYLFMMVILPILLAESTNDELKGDRLYIVIHILFFLNFIIGSFSDSHIFSVTQEKILCIKQMHMKPGSYIKAALLIKYFPFYLYYLIAFLIMFPLIGGSITLAIVLWIAYICFRMLGEAIQLYVYDKKGYIISRQKLIILPFMLIALVAAYLPLLIKTKYYVIYLFHHPVAIIIYIILGLLSIKYVVSYKHYTKKLPRTIDLRYSYKHNKEEVQKNSFRDVAIKEKDLLVSNANNKYDNLKGYSYLNALFFERHRRLLVKPILIRLCIILLALLSGIIMHMIRPGLAINVSKNIPEWVPSLVFVMYLLTTANKACRAMFYNCDISLLRHGFYRRPKTVLHNFWIRFIKISLYNIIIALALDIAIIIFLNVCKAEWMSLDMLLLYASTILLSIFFTIHHMFMYYVFQPYTSELSVNNPFFKLINGIIYFLSYMCFQIKGANIIFTIIILAFTLIYITFASVIIVVYAPKHFRVK